MSSWESAGKSDEWYTPAYVFDALGERFDLDVSAPTDRTQVCVPADRFITADSLNQIWTGFVWMNPPFGGRGAKMPWLEKFFAHGDGIALTPDRTSAPWFRYAWAHADALLFTPKIKFIKPDGSAGGSPGNGTCLWAGGPRAVRSLERARDAGLGVMAAPCRAGASQRLAA